MRIHPGERIEPLQLTTVSSGALSVPTAGLTHLQFRRFAGCPICNFRLRQFSLRVKELTAAGITPVVFFHTDVETMASYREATPFAVVADPGRTYYRRFGVERSLLASLHPRAMAAAMKTMLGGGSMFSGAGAVDGLPAEFLLGPDGTVLGAKYGTHADDHWEIEEILTIARGATASASGKAPASAPA